MNYDYQTHISLLKEAQALREQNKFLEDVNFSKYRQLLKYSAQMSNHFHWLQKNKYLQLIHDFLSFKLPATDFKSQFSTLLLEIEAERRSLETNLKTGKLKSLQLDPKSADFELWVSEISLCCDEFDPRFKPTDDLTVAEKTEAQLRSAVANLLPILESY